MKVDRCATCGKTRLPLVDYRLKATVRGAPFEASVRAQQCQDCGEAFLSGDAVESCEISAALALERAGVTSPEGLRFIRAVRAAKKFGRR
jgi:hypothetical protein